MTPRRWHRPGWLAIALTCAGIALFARLGVWQLDRATQAQQLEASFEAAMHAPAASTDRLDGAWPEEAWPHLRVAGHFVADRAYLRDEQMRHGTLGVEAYAVFAPDHGQAADKAALLLVDRGWIAASGASRVSQALAPGDVVLSGVYAPFPGSGLRPGGNALPAQATWPKLTLAIDPLEIAADLGGPVLPRVLLLDPDAASGFERTWTPSVMPPERHRGYALQWFAFALAALVIFILVHFRKV